MDNDGSYRSLRLLQDDKRALVPVCHLSTYPVTFWPLIRHCAMQDVEEKGLLYRLESSQDPEAFSELYTHYYTAVYRFIRYRVESEEIAEDIAGDVFFKLWVHVTERRRLTNFKALAYRIARHTVIDHYRKRRPTISLDALEEVGMEPITEDLAAIAGGAMDLAIDQEKLAQALRELKEEDIEIMTLFYSEGMRIKEIATVVGKRSGAIRVRLHRALKTLHEKLLMVI